MATIVRLPESTIKLIAAGEVVTRPYNVIKELLENSLDAGATNIRVVIERGGLESIEITDNGHGIMRANSVDLCRRYTTSKLSQADDLNRIATFGFRGEALSSICEMACSIEVETYNPDSDKYGWVATYKRGELVSGPTKKRIEQAGTYLKVNKLFDGNTHRKKASQAVVNDEKKSITELITRYAIHYRDKVTIVLREGNSDLVCNISPIALEPCLGSFYGLEVQNNVIDVDLTNAGKHKASIRACVSYKRSTVSHSSIFILFVNNRLVEMQELRKEIEAVVSDYIVAKQNNFIIYIAITVAACDVDVNAHPSKATVILHYQSEITQTITDAFREKFKDRNSRQVVTLGSQASSKTVDQTKRSASQTNESKSAVNVDRLKALAPEALSQNQQRVPTQAKSQRQYDIVHNDCLQPTFSQLNGAKETRPTRDMSMQPDDLALQRPRVNLRSIMELRQQVATDKANRADIIKSSIFVGLFDHDFALIQHETKLYAINLRNYLREQYYQFYLFDFANFPPIEILPPGNKIEFLIDVYLDDMRKHERKNYDSLEYKETKQIIQELLKHQQMFEDYFSLRITDKEVLTIPCIMPDEVPNLVFLGRFLSDLVNQVDYIEEKSCLQKIGQLFASFYSEPPANLRSYDVHKRYHDLIESKLYVTIKNYLIIPERLFAKENICQISDTKDLYKVFERC